jgi:uncharacterized protein (TIGR00730 family)
LKTICVNCGSSPKSAPEFLERATHLGRTIASRGLVLAYGGASIGLMGAVADGALEAGGKVVGVIPEALAGRVWHPGLHDLEIVPTMHQRKQRLFDLADGFVALPGGYGTLEEFFELLTWAQLGMNPKPVGLLNTSGYFDTLLEFLDRAVAEKFISESHRELPLVAAEADELLDRMGRYRYETAGKWLDPEPGKS